MSKKKIWISAFLTVIVLASVLWLRLSRDFIIISFGIRTLHTIEATWVYVASCTIIYFSTNVFLIIRERLSLAAKSKEEAESKIIAEKKFVATLNSDPSKRLSFAITSCLDEKPTTPFFKDSLRELEQHVVLVDKRVNRILDMAAEEFGENTLSYNQFVQPVQHLYHHLVDSGMDAVRQIEMFDALRYTNRIDNAPSAAARKEYEEVMQRYRDLITSTLSVFEQAVLKLDKLQVEISSLGFDNVKEAVETLSHLETVIQNTALWKE